MKPFYFNLLKYVHSPFLGEEVNVGMLFYFPEQRRLEFRFPDSLRRLRYLYRQFPERQTKVYLQGIGERVDRANKHLSPQFSVSRYETFIERELLKTDATVLRFSSTKKAVAHTDSIRVIVEQYYNQYFEHSQPVVAHERVRDEEFILRKFRTSLRKQDSGVSKLLTKDFEVSVPETKLVFNYAWQNGTLNLVKPISFDLKNEVEIHKKALYYYGNFNLLASKARESKYRFDILVAGPNNPSLNREYRRAVSILRETDAPTKLIVEDDELADYSEDAAKNLRDHHQPTDIGLFLPNSDG